MSNKPNFYVQGPIEPGVPFHIACKYTVPESGGPFITGTNRPAKDDSYWTFLGVQEKYVNFDNVYDKPFYLKKDSKYYCPLYLKGGTDRTEFSDSGLPFSIYYNDDLGQPVGTDKPPEADKNYSSFESIRYTRFYVIGNDGTNGNGYYYPLTLYQPTEPHHTHTFTNEYPSLNFYMLNTFNNHAKLTVEDQEGQCLFFNPYASIMNSKFKYHQNKNGTISIELVSNGYYDKDADQYRYLGVGSDGTLKPYKENDINYQFGFTRVNNENINTYKIYSGVSHILTSDTNITFNYVSNIEKNSDFLSTFLGGTYIGTPSTTNFMGMGTSSTVPDYSTLTPVVHESDKKNLQLYFIPVRESTYQISSHDLLTHMEYTAPDMLTMSPNVYNVKPEVIAGPAEIGTYYQWVENTGIITSFSDLAFTTELSDAMIGIHSRYCSENETCGSCHGRCNPNDISKPSMQCVFDSLSVEKFSEGQAHTCDHERYIEKSSYVRRGFLENHSSTAIIILLTITIVFFVGFILFEERKQIFKEFMKFKKKA